MYRHKQRNLALFSGIILALVALLQAGAPFHEPSFIFILVFLLLVAVSFSWLTVEVTDSELRLFFGPGLIRKRIPLSDIVSAEKVRNKWWWGWGIRYYWKGWMWNVWGLDAVELKLKNGRFFRVGTDEPGHLTHALQMEMKS